MVVYWRRRKASAPSLMAFEMACMASVPVSAASTWRANKAATRSESTLMVRMAGRKAFSGTAIAAANVNGAPYILRELASEADRNRLQTFCWQVPRNTVLGPYE